MPFYAEFGQSRYGYGKTVISKQLRLSGGLVDSLMDAQFSLIELQQKPSFLILNVF